MINSIRRHKGEKGLATGADRVIAAEDVPVTQDAPLLHISNLTVDFGSERGPIHAVRGIEVVLSKGQGLAIVGESGSGKSVTGRAMLGLISHPGRVRGEILLEGHDIAHGSEAELEKIRGEDIAMVFQDSLDSLNPVFSVGSQISEIFQVRRGSSRSEAHSRAVELLEQVGIPAAADRMRDYPHQFSGGMRQRICIAMAIALDPKILIADEPTTALDVTVQAGILGLIRALQRENNMALIFVTHDLSVARLIATHVAVMYAGRIMEQGPIDQIFARPAHPYTRALLNSQPSSAATWEDLNTIQGTPPDKSVQVPGCQFHPRCPLATDLCRLVEPDIIPITEDRGSRCHYAAEVFNGTR